MLSPTKRKRIQLSICFLLTVLLLITGSNAAFAGVSAVNRTLSGFVALPNNTLAPAGGVTVTAYVANESGAVVASKAVKINEKSNSATFFFTVPEGHYYIYYQMNFNPLYELQGYYTSSGTTVLDKPASSILVYGKDITNVKLTLLPAEHNRYISGTLVFPAANSFNTGVELTAYQEAADGSFKKFTSTLVTLAAGNRSVPFSIVLPNLDKRYIIKYRLYDYSYNDIVLEGFYSTSGTIIAPSGEIPVSQASAKLSAPVRNLVFNVLPNVMGNSTATIASPAENAPIKSGQITVPISGTYADYEQAVSEVYVCVKNETTGEQMTSQYNILKNSVNPEYYNEASLSKGAWSLNVTGNFQPGSYIIKVYSDDGKLSAEPVVSHFRITSTSNATATITSLTDNSVLTVGPASISGTASDPDGVQDMTGVSVTISAEINGGVYWLDAAGKSWVRGQIPFNQAAYSDGSWSLDLSGIDFPAGIYRVKAYGEDGGVPNPSPGVLFTVVPGAAQ